MKFLSFLKSPFNKTFFIIYLLTFLCFLISLTPSGEWLIYDVFLPNWESITQVDELIFGLFFFILGVVLMIGYPILLIRRAPISKRTSNNLCAYLFIWLVALFFAKSIYIGIMAFGIIALCLSLIMGRKEGWRILGCYIIFFLALFSPFFIYHSSHRFKLNECLCAILTFVLLYSEIQVTLALIQNAQKKE